MQASFDEVAVAPIEVRNDSMAPEMALRMASVLWPGRAPTAGSPLPPLWHWAYFPELVPSSDLAADGHPRRSDEWVSDFPRRMAGGGRVRFLEPLVVGVPAERRTELQSVRRRSGRSGELVIADWRHIVSQGGSVVIDETQTLLYRRAAPSEGRIEQEGGAASGGAAQPPRPEAAPGRELRRLVFGPVELFRFSAATWNAHRIHYDHEFVCRDEGYPGLVVHGPLLFCMLAGEAERLLGTIGEATYRAVSPVFSGEEIMVLGRPGERGYDLEARSPRGVAATLSASSG